MSLRVRTITALVFGVIMIGGTLLLPETSAILYAVVGVLCLNELAGLVLIQDSSPFYNKVRHLLMIIFGMIPAALVAAHHYFPNHLEWSAFYLLGFIPFLFELFAGSKRPFENVGYTFLGPIYIGITTALLVFLSLNHFSGRFLIMATVLLIWANDVFAYFVGSSMGKRKIFPTISPNKTWEGTFGGFLAAILWGVVSYYMWFVMEYEIWQWMVLGAICSVFGIAGDLVASMLKRSLNIKDTGSTLPGHGGLIDRFDAFIFATPFIAYTIIYIFQDSRFFF